jgi:hypothetical protein
MQRQNCPAVFRSPAHDEIGVRPYEQEIYLRFRQS